MSSTYLRTDTLRNAWSKSTASPQPAGMPEVATTGSESAPLTRIRRRPRLLEQRKVDALVALGAVQEDRCEGLATSSRSLRFSCERKCFVKGPRSNGGFTPTRTKPAPFRDTVLLPRSPNPVDHGQEGDGPSLPSVRGALLGELEVEKLPEGQKKKKDFKFPNSLQAKGTEIRDRPMIGPQGFAFLDWRQHLPESSRTREARLTERVSSRITPREPRLPELGPSAKLASGDLSGTGGPTLQGAHSQVPHLSGSTYPLEELAWGVFRRFFDEFFPSCPGRLLAFLGSAEADLL
eukprot:6475805-Amphidinium_carterae.5